MQMHVIVKCPRLFNPSVDKVLSPSYSEARIQRYSTDLLFSTILSTRRNYASTVN